MTTWLTCAHGIPNQVYDPYNLHTSLIRVSLGKRSIIDHMWVHAIFTESGRHHLQLATALDTVNQRSLHHTYLAFVENTSQVSIDTQLAYKRASVHIPTGPCCCTSSNFIRVPSAQVHNVHANSTTQTLESHSEVAHVLDQLCSAYSSGVGFHLPLAV
jgi:hypothetical protein